MTRLTVADLHVRYRAREPGGAEVRAVDGAGFELLLGGEALGLIGESGCGKSSLALALLRLLPAGGRAWGSLRLGDLDLLSMPLERFRRDLRWRRLAVVMQGALHSLNPVLRVGAQVGERMWLEGVPRREAARRAEALLERVGLPASAAVRYPHELSGGMRQRVLIAMALALDPQVLVLDEPTSALDVSVQAQVMNLLKDLKRERGLSMLFVTHDLALASDLCDRIAVLYAGEVRELGGADEVLTAPADPYSRALLDALPRLRGDERPVFLPGTPPDAAAPPAGCRFAPRCPRVYEPCRDHPPPLAALADGRLARCWLHQRPPDGAA